MKFDGRDFYKNLLRKSEFGKKQKKISALYT